MSVWIVPAELTPPTPRKVGMKTGSKPAMLLIQLPFAVLSLLIAHSGRNLLYPASFAELRTRA